MSKEMNLEDKENALHIGGVMHRCIAYEDIDRCFDTLFTYMEKREHWFKREQYITYATVIAETIELEKKLKKLNGAYRTTK